MTRVLLLIALAASPAAQPPPEAPPIVIAIRPAAEPVPALKYRLVPEHLQLLPGNAAIFYHRANLLLSQARASRANSVDESPKPGDEMAISKWSLGPQSEIPKEEARKHLEPFRNALREVELGAQRNTCDWGLDSRTEGYYLLIPEIQEMRSLARLIALEARLAILDGQTDEAMRWIQTGLVLGRHVGDGPTLIQLLVGVAIDSIMLKCVEDLIQAPGTPTLYWAFADRPRPFIDMRRPMESERNMLETAFPDLDRLDDGVWSVEQTRRFVETFSSEFFALSGGEPMPGSGLSIPSDLPSAMHRMGIAAMAAKVYPRAKRELIAGGRSETEVEAMPVIQASTLYSLIEYRRWSDGIYKWMNLPYWQSFDRADSATRLTLDAKLANPLLALFQMLQPALNSVRLASVRLERQLDALQCIEAIRLHAAAHGGKLPATLDAVTEVPAPLDPATGKPFGYRLDGDTATLSAPLFPGAPGHPSYTINYVLKPASQ